MSHSHLSRFGVPLLAGGVVALALAPAPEFWFTQLSYIGLYAVAALGLVLMTGVSGLTSFGQAAFVGIGAYATAYLSTTLHLSPWLGLIVGLAVAAVSALILGWITLRMSGHYLPLATIAWGLSLYYLMGNLDALGKYDGLLGIPGLNLFGIEVGQERGFFVLSWAVFIAAAIAVTRLLDSRPGRAIRALKQGAILPEAMGVPTLSYKIGVFLIAALLAAISGWLYAHFQQTVNPSPFGLKMGIEYLFMVVVGGVGYVWGALAGAAVTKLVEDQLQVLLPKLIGTSGNYEIIVFGIVLVLVLKYAPDGLWSFTERFAGRRTRKRDWGDAPSLAERDKPAAGEVVLEVDQVHKRFGGLIAVNNVSFDVRAGEIVGLIGPNGAGKTTTFNLVTSVLPLTSGQVRFRGERIDGRTMREIAKQGIVRTFQHVRMVPDMTVLENVALGAHLRGKSGTVRAMLRLDREEERQLFREAERQLARIGMESLAGEIAGNLAMGQQRLMEIARALCADPSLLLLDEPAAGLRYREKQALADVLRQLRGEGMSILLVEHDMDLVMEVSDRIVVMEFGTRLMTGTPADVQASPEVRAAYLGTVH